MKSLVVKTAKKPKQMEAALQKFNESSDVKVYLNGQFKYTEFGYLELIIPKVKQKDQRQVFQMLMHTFAHMKIWVECLNVQITTKHGQEWVKNNIGARYNGSSAEDPTLKRWENLNIDGADRLGALNHRKHRMRYDSIRWFTDGVMEEQMKEIKDDDGNVVDEEPSGNFALNFDFEQHGHSENYSNYKHFRRKYYDIIWAKWSEEMMGIVPRREPKKKEKIKPVESNKDDVSTLTGQALFEALNPHLK